MKWVCKVCGYVHEGPEAPEACPVCKAPKAKFEQMAEEKTWAAEHVIGIGKKDATEEIIQGVKDGMMQRSITPMFCGSALGGYGTKRVMEYIAKFCPNPLEGLALQTEEGGEMKLDPAGSPMAFVYKTISDQFGITPTSRSSPVRSPKVWPLSMPVPATTKSWATSSSRRARTPPRPPRSPAATWAL